MAAITPGPDQFHPADLHADTAPAAVSKLVPQPLRLYSFSQQKRRNFGTTGSNSQQAFSKYQKNHPTPTTTR